MTFELSLDDFQGPIDALLQLIEKRKLPINTISLADIADEYIRFVGDLKSSSLSDTTHFIFVASTLTLIKSKSLLPSLDLTDEEEGDIEDLEKRLRLLQLYQEKGVVLASLWKQEPLYFPKSARKQIAFRPHESLVSESLHQALSEIIAERPLRVSTKKEVTMKIAVHIEEMMHSLEERIQSALHEDFSGFTRSYIDKAQTPKEARVYQVVAFLAMLELVRNGVMQVMQEENFSHLRMEKI